ncbi:MAG TPA: FKBP-type peptidyl-prolyl cis-trans isomerase [Terriglobales bacterium]|nr:FKBP-type peptidyl-prolyl cis-trans isomerase [Terriglobales bacterium]
MPKHLIFLRNLLLAGLLAGGFALCAAQTTATQPSTTPAAKKPAAAAASKTASKSAPAKAPLVLKTPKDKLSYAIGADLGTKLHNQSIDVDPAILARALRDALSASKPSMTPEEVRATLMDVQSQMRQKQMAAAKEAGEKNLKEGAAFLAENKTKEGVVTLPSGLQYKILKAGDGAKPTAADTVVCNYRGTLIDGTEFDSSYKRGQPASFPVGGVIKGWTEALQLMPVGSKWQLFIPPDMAYGEHGAGGAIGPNSTLIFEVELLSIQGK